MTLHSDFSISMDIKVEVSIYDSFHITYTKVWKAHKRLYVHVYTHIQVCIYLNSMYVRSYVELKR